MRQRWILPVTLAVLAGALWFFLLRQAERTVFVRAPLLDEVYYLDRAAEFADDGISDQPFFMSPLFPLLAAWTGGGDPVPESGVVPPPATRGIRLMNLACWLGTVLLLRRIAGRTLGGDLPPGRRRTFVLWLPAVLFGLYRPAAVYSLSILVELPLVFLVAGALDLISRRELDRRGAAVLGVVIGLAGLLRSSALLLLPAALWIALHGGRGSVGRWSRAGLLVAGVLLVTAPPALHNSRLAGRPLGPTVNGGLNFYIGNGPEATGFYTTVFPGDWRRDPAGTAFLAERFERDEVSVAEADRLWTAAGREAVADAPGRFLGLFLRKIHLHFQGWEIDQIVSLRAWTDQIPLLKVLAVPWWLLSLLGGTGVILALVRRSARSGTPIPVVRIWSLVFVLLVCGQSLFFVVSRYRLVLVPILALLAGWVASVALREISGWRTNRTTVRRAAWPAVVLLGVAAATVPWGLGEVRTRWEALSLANEALRRVIVAEAEASPVEFERAERLYARARDLAPGQEGLRSGLTTARKGRTVLYLAQEKTAEALVVMESILRDEPHETDTLHNYAIALARSGRAEEALAAATTLRDHCPEDPRGFIDTGILLARSGQPTAAAAVFRAGLVRHPNHPELTRNLALVE